MSSLPNSEAEQIQQEMVRVRRELHGDVEEVVASAKALTDWRQYVRSYPWICVGAAAAVGYLIVPSRPKVRKIASLPFVGGKSKSQETAAESGAKSGATAGIVGSLVSTVGTLALRSAMTYASRRATNWVNERMSGSPSGASNASVGSTAFNHRATNEDRSASAVSKAPRIYPAPGASAGGSDA